MVCHRQRADWGTTQKGLYWALITALNYGLVLASDARKLFIAYIVFSKAYDRVPISKMLDTLKRLGCGFVMLFAIATMYKVTRRILGTAIIIETIGVRQGSPTFLYIILWIRMIKDRSLNDGFLQWLHGLMLMDDTVILVTSRDSVMSKLEILCEFCRTHGMVMNDKKAKFMDIDGLYEDHTKMSMEKMTIAHCDVYVYFGACCVYIWRKYSISQEICTRFLLCCALLWLYIDWFSHIHQAYFTGTVAI